MGRHKLWAIAMFLVTWKTYQAVFNPYYETEHKDKCELRSENHQEEFSDWFKAAARSTELKRDPANYDVRTWELEEPIIKERR